MRLSPPTNKTFCQAFGALALGVVLWVAPVEDVSPDTAFGVGHRSPHRDFASAG